VDKATHRQLGILILSFIAVAGLALGASAQPIASFSAVPASQGTPLGVAFDASASQAPTGGQIVSYQWAFGDGFTGSGEKVTHSYASPGDYAVTLMLFDNQGKTGSTTVTIHVDADGAVSGATQEPPAATPSGGSTQTPTVTVQRANLPVGIKVGEVAPDFTLHDPNGKAVRLSDYLGRVVILDFWRSTCPACQSALPDLESLLERYQDKGLVVLSISLDASRQDGQTYLSHNGFSNFVELWNEPAQEPVYKMYGVGSIPFSYVIDVHGVIRYKGSLEQLTAADIQPWL